ncbi:MAG: hypothetical protein K2X47_03820 [Bdellovibrionales bacterium]|nr:hypothetical protein [Bdellovibrionales bacterium]
MATPRSLSFIGVFLIASAISCSHVPRKPATIGPSSGSPSDFTPTPHDPISLDEAEIDFGDTCKKSKVHVAVLEQATTIMANPYFQQLIRAHYSGYEPKLAISEPDVSECKNCMRIRFLYAKDQGIKSIEVLVKNGELLQTKISRHEIDFSNAPPELKALAKEIPQYDELECEISAGSTSK